MPISVLYNGNPINGTIEDDFIFAIPGTTGTNANTITGNAGDDFILADISSVWLAPGTLTNNSFASAMNIDNFNVWTLDENPLIENSTTVPHTTVAVEATAAQGEVFSFTATAGQSITIDVDFGIATALANIGISTDCKILLIFNGLVVAENIDESGTIADPLLRYTANSTGTYYIVIQPDDVSVFNGGETFILNVSVTGHALGAATVMGDDVIDGGDGDDYIAAVGGADTVQGGAGNDFIDGGSGNDQLFGGDGRDQLQGYLGDDRLAGDAGNDILNGGDGDDILTGGDGDDLLIGGAGIDSVDGGAQDDTLDGGDGNDRLAGDAGDDVLRGGDGDDVLTGGDGDDFLAGGAGIDSVDGGTGNDRIAIGQDVETLNGGLGVDRLEYFVFNAAAVTINLATGFTSFGATVLGFENFVADGAYGDITLFGSSDENNVSINVGRPSIYTYDASDYIETSVNALVVDGGSGFDWIDLEASPNVTVLLPFNMMSAGGITCTSLFGIEGVVASSGNDTVIGGSEDNIFVGLGGNDILIGGLGIDQTDGGAGDDVHHVDNASDMVFERDNEGFDRVVANVSYQLPALAAVEVLNTNSPQGTDAINLSGNGYNQEITGNAGANVLRGFAGNDALAGLAGNDTLDGGLGDDTLIGDAGNDVLVGGDGADIMRGGTGDDQYLVDSLSDQVFESVGGGDDIVFALSSFVLGAGQEVEELAANSPTSTVRLDLTGNEFANRLYGSAGVNLLIGGGGADLMVGFAGNDQYLVDNAGDQVIEAAGGGDDIVFTLTSYALAAGQEIEELAANNGASTTGLDLTGNEFANRLYGNAGVNLLIGGGGADLMVGFGGNDQYLVDNAGDQVMESAGGGYDIVFALTSYALQAGQEIEELAANNPSATTRIDLTGNALANGLYGNAGTNVLYGGGGNDIMAGFGGADFFAFDTALAGAGVDQILDFQVGIDKIALDDTMFGGLAAVTASNFVTGTSAQDADDRIIYDPNTGALFFDADGNGAGAAIQFAALSTGLALSASDFMVI